MKKLLRKGFTIVELVIVIAVIAILAGVLIPTFSGVVEKANQSAALQKATSAMKSTLSMNTYGTIADGTQFIIVSGEKVAYKFDYKNNAIESIKSTEALPTDANAFIVRGTTASGSTTIGDNEVKLIKAIAAKTGAFSDLANVSTGRFINEGDYYSALVKVESAPTEFVANKYYTAAGVVIADAAGLTAAGADVYVKLTYKFFVNTDYPADIITATKSN